MKVSCAPTNLILCLKDPVVQIKHDYCSYIDVQHERFYTFHDHISVTVTHVTTCCRTNACGVYNSIHKGYKGGVNFLGISNLQKLSGCGNDVLQLDQPTVTMILKVNATKNSHVCTIHSDSFILNKHSCQNMETGLSLIQITLTDGKAYMFC